MTANLALVAPATALSATRKLRCKCSASCDAETNNLFAQGHDARLVSLQVAAVMAGETTANEAVRLIAALAGAGTPLVAKFRGALANAQAKEGRRNRAAARRGVKAVRTVTAKVGRWTYEGTVAGGVFTYTDRAGNTKTTTKFAQV